MRFDQHSHHWTRKIGRSPADGDFDPVESDVLLSESTAEVDVDSVVQGIDSSRVEVEYIPGHCFTAIFHGADLLSFGKLLRLDHRTGELRRYRSACLNAADRAVLAAERMFECRRLELPARLSVSLYRSGTDPFDNDELVASYKLLIDGFRQAGLLNEGDPSHIASFDSLLQRCGSNEPLSVGITFRRA